MTNSQTKISTFYYNKSGNFCLIVCHEALFNWKLFKLGSVSVKDIRKNVPILQVGGSSHILSTPPVVWVVLLHKMAFCQSFISTTVCPVNLLFTKVITLFTFLYKCVLHFSKVQFNGKARGQWPERHTFDQFEFWRFYFLQSLAVLSQIARPFLDFYQNYMAFQPLISSLSVKRDFNKNLGTTGA